MADEADQADRSRRGELSPRDPKAIVFLSLDWRFTAREEIRPISCIRRIRVEPLNLDAGPSGFSNVSPETCEPLSSTL
jgi:hypothetical protein